VFRLGLVVNPLAGVGGPAALKGSDGVADQALARGAHPQASERAARVLASLVHRSAEVELLVWGGPMGAHAAARAGLAARVLGAATAEPSRSEDTVAAVRALAEAGCELILFAGGDGTARDLVAALAGVRQPVLGIPAGVKMHSGVFAVTPEAAGRIVLGLLDGALVGVAAGEVRDIDEAGYRAGVVRTRHFGELLVPSEPRWVQHTKVGGRESEPLVLEELGAWVAELMADEEGATWIVGPGSTTAAILAHQGLEGTLLGVDVVRGGRVVLADATAAALEAAVDPASAHVLVTAIGGQGHVLGRGNQQLSAALLRRIGRGRFHVVATRSKLAALEGRPLVLDSGDAELDLAWAGVLPVLVGYDDRVLYPVGQAVSGEAAGATAAWGPGDAAGS
jgi:predicted polyphosphate/ATP-dependent NAD kinase